MICNEKNNKKLTINVDEKFFSLFIFKTSYNSSYLILLNSDIFLKSTGLIVTPVLSILLLKRSRSRAACIHCPRRALSYADDHAYIL